jgi:hypothetical protein
MAMISVTTDAEIAISALAMARSLGILMFMALSRLSH